MAKEFISGVSDWMMNMYGLGMELKEAVAPSPGKLRFVQYYLSHACDQDCGFCVAKDQRIPVMSRTNRREAFGRIKEFSIKHPLMSIIGGEPTLHPDLLVEAVEDASDFGFHVSVVSNGFGLNEELLERLGNAGLERLGISLDTEGVSNRVNKEKMLGLLETAKSLNIIPALNSVFTRKTDVSAYKQLVEEVISHGIFFNMLYCSPAVDGGAFSGAPKDLIATNAQMMEIVPWLMWKKLRTGYVESTFAFMKQLIQLSSDTPSPPSGIIFQEIVDTRRDF